MPGLSGHLGPDPVVGNIRIITVPPFLRTSPKSSPLGTGPLGNMTLPTLIIPINYVQHCTMPRHKNTMPTNKSMVCCAKLAELE